MYANCSAGDDSFVMFRQADVFELNPVLAAEEPLKSWHLKLRFKEVTSLSA